MIRVVCPGDLPHAAETVCAAFRRSFGHDQVTLSSADSWHRALQSEASLTVVAVEPPDDWAALITSTLGKQGAKLVLFGGLPPSLARSLDVRVNPVDSTLRPAASCEPPPLHGFSESRLGIAYRRPIGTVSSPILQRAFLRLDHADGWNCLGFGAVRTDDSIWGWAQMAYLPGEAVLADVTLDSRPISGYAGLWDREDASLLWFNRPVGPIDSQEWRLVETFLAHHRYPDLACSPCLAEIPYGFEAAATMRLDCDEDVASALPLWETYSSCGLPLSLAVHTVLLEDRRHHALLKEVAQGGGAVLSHSATHLPEWGGSYESAFREAVTSATKLADVIGSPVRYAVSPFHQNPPFARVALADAGYSGCIGGIVQNDPDFVMARGGPPPGSPASFVGHSQQCMLHGDQAPREGDPLATFKEAFDIARRGRALFGYLDHPFSERYQYGWVDEASRLEIHRGCIEYLRSHEGLLFVNENDAMDFLQYRAAASIHETADGFTVMPSAPPSSSLPLAVEFGGRIHRVDEGGWQSWRG